MSSLSPSQSSPVSVRRSPFAVRRSPFAVRRSPFAVSFVRSPFRSFVHRSFGRRLRTAKARTNDDDDDDNDDDDDDDNDDGQPTAALTNY